MYMFSAISYGTQYVVHISIRSCKHRPDFANVEIKRKWITGSLIQCVIKDAIQENPSSDKRNSALKGKNIRSVNMRCHLQPQQTPAADSLKVIFHGCHV